MKILATIGLIVLAAIGYSMTATPAGTLAQPSYQHSSIQQTSSLSVTSTPSVPRQFIDKILCTPSSTDIPTVSPACGTGRDLYDLGIKYGIDPVIALAFFQHESSFGRYGVAAQNKGLGNIRCSQGYICKSGFRAYSTWEEGYQDWYKLISEGYVTGSVSAQCPCTTIAQIITIYAPSSENNTQQYINTVIRSVTSWRQEAAQ